MRLVHFTDLHLQPERGAFEGAVAGFEKIESLVPQVDALLLGGDIVMNSVAAKWDRALAQWDLWTQLRTRFPSIPMYSCIGNMDCWGWNQKASGCTGQEPLFGKALAMERLAMDRTYYTAKLSGWRLIVLDGIQRGGKNGFIPAIDPEQLEWLKERLEEDRTVPTMIMTHVPIVPGPADFFAMDVTEPSKQGFWELPGHQVHYDGYSLCELLRGYPNVRLCVAGHVHTRQRIEYAGLWFIGSPAGCGAWWRGDFLGYPRGFTIIDLMPDGRFEVEFGAF